MGRSTLKAVAGSLPTALAPPACVTRASSPVPTSNVSAPVPSPTRRPVTVVLDARVLGMGGGAGMAQRQHLISIFLPLYWSGWQRRAVPEVALILIHPNPEGWGCWGAENATPGIAASLKSPWSCSALTRKTVSMRAGSMSQGRASSLGQTPVKCASVRWVRAMLGGWSITGGTAWMV